ncbi:hypothetical protein [Oleisolibacter albus]|uniref:hypothetical protein n=1 Tax=Oleisolibacter albus TaxID=2171757 RepID=UPI000DF15175|nr:hypothetical protein [Oleisolibacter albus]
MSGLFWNRLGLVLLGLALLAAGLGFRQYGITWDEPLHVEYGRRALAWYASLGQDRSLLDFQNLYLYGALYDVTAALAQTISPLDDYGTRRLLGALAGLLGVVGAGRLAGDMAGPRAGTLAMALLLLTPDWWGHAFANPKDVPVGTAMVWALVFGLRTIRTLPAPAAGTLVGLGASIGATLGIRIGAGIIVLPLLLGAALRVGTADNRARFTGTALLRLMPAVLLAWAIMVAAWPWAQLAPLSNPIRGLAEFSHFPLDFTFPLWGVPVRSTNLPWWYVPAGFAAKLPEPVLVGLTATVMLALFGLHRRKLPADRAALAAAILLPPLIVVATGAVLYDGIRHLLFLLPPLAAAAALGLDALLARLSLRWAAAMLAALALWTGLQTAILVRLHPYETIWFNSLVGGPRGAEGRFELDGWGSALTEAARTLTATVRAQEGDAALTHPYRVRVCGPSGSALTYLPAAWRAPADGKGPADFFLSFTRSRCGDEPEGPVLVRIERDGVLLAFVKDLRSLPDDPAIGH